MADNVKYIDTIIRCKEDDQLMAWVGKILGPSFMFSMWTTYRLPFCRPVIAYPVGIMKPYIFTTILQHEMVHVRQLAPWYGPLWVALLYFLIPLPVLFSGRWLIEREAYMVDILCAAHTPESAAETLWKHYWKPWPKALMIRWFKKQHSKRKRQR